MAKTLMTMMRAQQDFFRATPEWWLWAICAASWTLIIQSGEADAPRLCSATGSARGLAFSPDRFGANLVMTSAMMLPLAVAPARHVAFRSFWTRRHAAIATFLLAYYATWMVALGIGDLAVDHLGWIKPLWTKASVAAVVAVIWQCSSTKEIALRACHRTMPLTAYGWRATLDCLSYGFRQARSCVTACWAAMFATLMLPPNRDAMICVSIFVLYERYRPIPLRHLAGKACRFAFLRHGRRRLHDADPLATLPAAS